MNLPKLIPAAVAVLLLPALSHAANRTWQPSGVANWEDDINWSGPAVPVSGDLAVIGNNGTATLSTATTINRMQVGNATVGAGHLNIATSGSLRLASEISSIGNAGSVLVAGVLSSGTTLNVSSGGLLTVASTGTALFTGYSGNTSRLGITTGTVDIDGGYLSYTRTLRVGGGADATATIVVRNGGTLISTASAQIGLGGSSDASYAGVTATLIVGGTTTAQAAGAVNVANIVGYQGSGAANTNTVILNHTGTRHYLRGSAASIVNLTGNLSVDARAGVTVLNGTSSYTGATTIGNGSTLLANLTTNVVGNSSTGVGAVTVQEGGTLGGIGWVGGATTVAGALKAGDHDYGEDDFGVLKFRDALTLQSTAEVKLTLGGNVRGTSFDAFDVGGPLTLAGTLELELVSGFNIADGQTLQYALFNVADNDITGGFSAFQLADEWNGLDLVWDVSALSSTGLVSVTAIPEPSSVVVSLGGAALLGAALRRRR